MMNNEKKYLDNKYKMLYLGSGSVLLLVILIYSLIIFCYDNFSSLFYWINYRFLENITPNIFIPNLWNNGSYEKTIILGFITLIVTIILPIYIFIYSLIKKIKYPKIFMTPDKKDPLMNMQVRTAGSPNRMITIIEILVIFIFSAFAFLWGMNTSLLKERILFEIFIFYFCYIGTLYVLGLYFALFIFKIFYQDILK